VSEAVTFQKEIAPCQEKVIQALTQTLGNRRFVDVNRARVLAYSGEVLMSALFACVLKDAGIDATHLNIDNCSRSKSDLIV
jgi:aspartokinase